MGASPSGRTLAEEKRSLPDCLDATDRFGAKVVGANEEGVNVQSLGAWRLVIGCLLYTSRCV